MTTFRTDEQIARDLIGADGTYGTVVGCPAHRTGYVVGVAGAGIVLEGCRLKHKGPVLEWIAGIKARTAEAGVFVGSWEDNGKVYYDLVRIEGERAVAEARARAGGELTIYNLGKNETIWAEDFHKPLNFSTKYVSVYGKG